MAIDIRGLCPLLQVFDMPASLHFYREALGFVVVSTSGGGDDSDWVLLSHKGTELMLNTMYERETRPVHPNPERIASHRDTILYFGCEDPEAAYEELRSKGLNVSKPVVQGYGMKQIYVYDPDGYNLCFQWPATEEMRESWRKRYGMSFEAEAPLET